MDAQTKIRLMQYGAVALVAIVIVLILIALATIKLPGFGGPDKDNTSINIIEHNDTTKNVTVCDDQCLYKKALLNSSLCSQLKNATLQESCYEKWSNSSLDFCLKTDNATKEVCLFYFAKATANVSICEYAMNKTGCAVNIDPCYAYESVERGRCFAFAKNDSSYCKDDDCRYAFAMQKTDTTSCQKIEMASRRMACISILERKDHCPELTIAAERDLCWQLYATTMDDPNVCLDISNESAYKLECHSYFAIKRHDLTVCDKIGLLLDLQWACYRNYSLGTGDLTGCININKLATTNKFICCFDFAKKFGDPSACNVINDSPDTNICYQGSILGRTNIDYTKCAAVPISDWRNKCYSEYAKYHNDPSMCDYIEKANEKEACVIAWQVYTNQTPSQYS
ncbi:MAG: hypothetical protein V1492_01495 [Candidatus Micrarchaeota archaeon]